MNHTADHGEESYAGLGRLQGRVALVAAVTAGSDGPLQSHTRAKVRALSQMAMKRQRVAPGPVWTPLIPSTLPNEHVRQFGQDTVFERAAQPVEIAPIFVFLASNEARFVTGEVNGATGGKSPF